MSQYESGQMSETEKENQKQQNEERYGVKNAKLIFVGQEQKDYEFNVDDLPKALAYAKQKNWPLLAIKTPWYWLSVMDDETGQTALEIFK